MLVLGLSAGGIKQLDQKETDHAHSSRRPDHLRLGLVASSPEDLDQGLMPRPSRAPLAS
jgi:hypothetical protein